jgi:hypothetical protein
MPRMRDNRGRSEVIAPQMNHWRPHPSVLPERFRSTSAPADSSLVARELNSVSTAQVQPERITDGNP